MTKAAPKQTKLANNRRAAKAARVGKKAAKKAIKKVLGEAPEDPSESPNQTITWRLPVRVASENSGNWEPLREHLRTFMEQEGQLDPEVPEETKHVSFRVPTDVLEYLEDEAQRLSITTGKRWTAGRVARHVWDEWEAS